jgi:hypothetical protein
MSSELVGDAPQNTHVRGAAGILLVMVKKGDKPMQKTPKGYEIPIPKRKDFDAILDKVAKPPKRSTPKRRPTK